MLPQTPKGILNSERDQFLVQECSRDVFAHFSLKISKGRRGSGYSGYRSRVHHLFRGLWAPPSIGPSLFPGPGPAGQWLQSRARRALRQALPKPFERRLSTYLRPIYDLSTTSRWPLNRIYQIYQIYASSLYCCRASFSSMPRSFSFDLQPLEDKQVPPIVLVSCCLFKFFHWKTFYSWI